MITSTSIPKHIQNLETAARIVGILAQAVVAAMIVTLFLAIADVTSVYPSIGLLGGFFVLVATQLILLQNQSFEAIKHKVSLADVYGKSWAHNQFVEPVLAKVENRQPL